MLKLTMSFALLLLSAAMAAAQETPAPAAATTAVQEAPAPVSADDTKLKPAIDGVAPSAEQRKVDPPAATASSPSPSEKPSAKRQAAARQHSTATREKARVVYPGYAAPM